MEFTKEQIDAYKAKHGEIYLVEIEGGKSCILRTPTRKDLSYMTAISDPIKMNETAIANLWVDGDEDIKTDDSLFFAVMSKIETLFKFKEATIKKL